MKSLFSKAKPFLVTAGVAILAVYAWNNWLAPMISPRVGKDLTA